MKRVKLTKIDSAADARLDLPIEFIPDDYIPEKDEDRYSIQEWKRITTKTVNDLATELMVKTLLTTKIDSPPSSELNRSWFTISMLSAIVEREGGKIFKYRRLEEETGFVFILGPRCYIVNTKDMLVAYGKIPHKKEFASCSFSDLDHTHPHGELAEIYDLPGHAIRVADDLRLGRIDATDDQCRSTDIANPLISDMRETG